MSQYDEKIGISVVMPAYNAEKTIEKAMDSVLSQTHGLLELIVVDDCSKDGTAAIISAYAQRDSRVRMLSNATNSGVSVTRNNGIRAATYEWIALLDSDDYWEPNKLQAQLSAILERPEAAICFTATAYINEKGERSEYILRAPSKVTRKDVLKQNVISCSSVLARREALLASPMRDKRNIHEDLAVWADILSKTPYAVGIDEPLLIYRVSSTGKSGNKVEAAKMQWRTYRVCQVPLLKSVYYFTVYAWRNVRKYRSVKNGMAQAQ